MSIAWNLPPGCHPNEIGGEEPDYDNYLDGCYDAMIPPDTFEEWVACGRPAPPDPLEEDGEYADYAEECEREGLAPGTYREWMDGYNAIGEALHDREQERGDFLYHAKREGD